MSSSQIDKFIYVLTRALYPNWCSLSFFTRGWDFFFQQEVQNIAVWFFLVSLVQMYVVGFILIDFIRNLALVILVRRYFAGGICLSMKKLHGQTVIITGGNTGIGKETARDLLRRGARIILACRAHSQAEDARRELAREGGDIETRQLDLANLQSIRDFANGIKKENIKIHILINNAGVFMCPYTETADGFELQMGTNHLGHFYLTNLLLPQLKHEEPARIINLASNAHCVGEINFDNFFMKENYSKPQVYGNSKLANNLFTLHLSKKLKGTNIQVFAVHPGAVATEITRHVMNQNLLNFVSPVVHKTPMEGAQTSIYCATEAVQHPLMYFSDCAVGWPIPLARNDVVAEKLWEYSAKLVGLKE